MADTLRIAFLGCGFITRVHSRHLQVAPARHRLRLRQPRSRRGRRRTAADSAASPAFGDYASAIDDPRVDAVVVAVPPRFHLDLTLQALAAGKHVLVEKPAFLRHGGLRRGRGRAIARSASCWSARTITTSRWRCGCARCSPSGAIGEMVFAHFTTIAQRLKTADDWRNDESMAGGDAFFEEGHSLAAPRRQPRPAHHGDSGLPAVGLARGTGSRAPRA